MSDPFAELRGSAVAAARRLLGSELLCTLDGQRLHLRAETVLMELQGILICLLRWVRSVDPKCGSPFKLWGVDVSGWRLLKSS